MREHFKSFFAEFFLAGWNPFYLDQLMGSWQKAVYIHFFSLFSITCLMFRCNRRFSLVWCSSHSSRTHLFSIFNNFFYSLVFFYQFNYFTKQLRYDRFYKQLKERWLYSVVTADKCEKDEDKESAVVAGQGVSQMLCAATCCCFFLQFQLKGQ